MSLVIGLIGQKLVGKDTVANYIATKYGAISIASSQILDDVLLVLGKAKSRENEAILAVGLRSAFGEDVLNTASLDKIKHSGAKIGLINGIRRPKELEQAISEGVRTIYITAPQEQRFERYKFRQEKKDDGVLSFEAFVLQDAQSPTEKDIEAIGLKAEFHIENDNDLLKLYQQIDVIMGTLLKS